MKPRPFGMFAFLVLCALALPLPSAYAVTTRTVTNTNDSGLGSLRDALNISVAGDTINFNLPLPATITLSTGSLVIGHDLTISGPGAPDLLTIDGNNASGVFWIVSGNVTISGVTIRNGNAAAPLDAGGITNGGNLTLTNSAVVNNVAASAAGGIYSSGASLTLSHVTVISNTTNGNMGGGIRSDGALTLSDTVIVSNTVTNTGGGCGGLASYGPATLVSVTLASNTARASAGMCTSASMTVTNSSIISNTATYGWAGGIYTSGPLTITNSTIAGNTTPTNGGGIVNNGGTVRLTNVTLSGNSASPSSGGGLATSGSSKSMLTNVSIANNKGGGISISTGTVTITNTLVADNIGSNCIGAVTSGGHNLDSGNTCLLGASGDLPNTDPLLGALEDNGGPTMTQALLTGSPAIDHGTNIDCPSADQRGGARPVGGTCDIGAYEYGETPTLTSIYPTSVLLGGPGFTLTLTGTNFISGAVAQWGGPPGAARTTSFSSSTLLTATIPASDLTTSGTHNISVRNPGPGDGTSNTVPFTVIAYYLDLPLLRR